jgi:signal peptidase I
VVGVSVALAAAVLVSGIVAALLGVRWFFVETPSMGQAAPVGSLVIVVPLGDRSVQVGEIISFLPAGAGRVYTHRVVEVSAAGAIATQGDANSARDGWELTHSDVIGRAIVVLPGFGYLLRMMPWLFLGWFVTRGLMSAVREPAIRRALEILGATATAVLVVTAFHPLVNGQLVGLTVDGDDSVATVVNTGMLPVVVSDVGVQEHLRLVPGQFGETVLRPSPDGSYVAQLNVDIGTWQFWALILISLIPLALSFRRVDQSDETERIGATV